MKATGEWIFSFFHSVWEKEATVQIWLKMEWKRTKFKYYKYQFMRKIVVGLILENAQFLPDEF